MEVNGRLYALATGKGHKHTMLGGTPAPGWKL